MYALVPADSCTAAAPRHSKYWGPLGALFSPVDAAMSLEPQSANAAETDNRRAHSRVAEPPLLVSGVDQVRDISAGGMSVKLFRPLSPGATDELILTEANCYHTRSMKAQVVWAVGRTAGLKWVDATAEEIAWLEGRISEWSRPEETVWVEPVKSGSGTVWRA
jgi:hypothetical protein